MIEHFRAGKREWMRWIEFIEHMHFPELYRMVRFGSRQILFIAWITSGERFECVKYYHHSVIENNLGWFNRLIIIVWMRRGVEASRRRVNWSHSLRPPIKLFSIFGRARRTQIGLPDRSPAAHRFQLIKIVSLQSLSDIRSALWIYLLLLSAPSIRYISRLFILDFSSPVPRHCTRVWLANARDSSAPAYRSLIFWSLSVIINPIGRRKVDGRVRRLASAAASDWYVISIDSFSFNYKIFTSIFICAARLFRIHK